MYTIAFNLLNYYLQLPYSKCNSACYTGAYIIYGLARKNTIYEYLLHACNIKSKFHKKLGTY